MSLKTKVMVEKSTAVCQKLTNAIAVIMVIAVRCNCVCCKTIILFGMALRNVTSLLVNIVFCVNSYNVVTITDEYSVCTILTVDQIKCNCSAT